MPRLVHNRPVPRGAFAINPTGRVALARMAAIVLPAARHCDPATRSADPATVETGLCAPTNPSRRSRHNDCWYSRRRQEHVPC